MVCVCVYKVCDGQSRPHCAGGRSTRRRGVIRSLDPTVVFTHAMGRFVVGWLVGWSVPVLDLIILRDYNTKSVFNRYRYLLVNVRPYVFRYAIIHLEFLVLSSFKI